MYRKVKQVVATKVTNFDNTHYVLSIVYKIMCPEKLQL